MHSRIPSSIRRLIRWSFIDFDGQRREKRELFPLCHHLSYKRYFVAYYLVHLRFRHTNVSWWFFTGIWDRSCFHKSPGLFLLFGRSQQCCCLDGLHSSSYKQVLQSLYQSFIECTERINYNWYHRHFHVQQFFQFSCKV